MKGSNHLALGMSDPFRSFGAPKCWEKGEEKDSRVTGFVSPSCHVSLARSPQKKRSFVPFLTFLTPGAWKILSLAVWDLGFALKNLTGPCTDVQHKQHLQVGGSRCSCQKQRAEEWKKDMKHTLNISNMV